MSHFIIQTVNGNVVHDFAFHLVQAIEHANWFYQESVHQYSYSESTTEYHETAIPVGSCKQLLFF